MTSSIANNQYWLLNSVTEWRTSTPAENLLQHSDGTLTLQTLPGEAQPFTPDPAKLLTCPSAVATDPCNGTYVLDTAAARVVQIARDGTIRTLIEFGGPGTDAGRFAAPRGLALAHGRIVVSDTGNHRVQVFSPSPFCLIQLWGKTDGGPGSGNMEFKYPWGTAADACGNIYIVDRGNGRVQKIALDGTWLSVIGEGELQDPTEIAVSPEGTIAVIDGAAGNGGGRVKVFARHASQPAILPTVIRPQALAYDPDGNLYVGSATGLVYHFAPDSSGKLEYVGAGVTGLDTAAVHLAWTAWQSDQKQLIGIFQDPTGARRLWFIPSESSFVSSGTFATGILDSGIEGCLWDRVTLMGKIPQGTSVKVEYFSAENASPPTVNLVPNPEDGGPYTFSNIPGSATATSGNSGIYPTPDATGSDCSESQWTCLVQCSPAQLLRLRFTFQSAGNSTPAISAIKVFFPRRSYLQYLPAIYQADPDSANFLDRFLSIFQSVFDGFDARIDAIWKLFDPDTVPEKYFDWLAAWLQLPTDPLWDLSKKRAMLKKAVSDYSKRGTLDGILQALKDRVDVPGEFAVVEHFRLRQWPLLDASGPICGGTRLWSRDFYQRLQIGVYSQVGNFRLANKPEPAAEATNWGANEFSVFFPASPYDPDALAGKVSAVVDQEKPAHAIANCIPVLPRFRVGVQATLGVDSSVGLCSRMALRSLSTLGYDTILNSSPAQSDVENLGASARPVAGVSTRLL